MTGDELARLLEEASVTLVDVRSPEEFSGKVIAPPGVQELAIRAGHVPGAKKFCFSASGTRRVQ